MKNIMLFLVALACLLALSGCDVSAQGFSPLLQETTLSSESIPLGAAPAQIQTITAEQAKEIALRHAGFSAADITGLRAEYDREDNHWEVDFRAGEWEYEYDIHGITGDILASEKDR